MTIAEADGWAPSARRPPSFSDLRRCRCRSCRRCCGRCFCRRRRGSSFCRGRCGSRFCRRRRWRCSSCRRRFGGRRRGGCRCLGLCRRGHGRRLDRYIICHRAGHIAGTVVPQGSNDCQSDDRPDNPSGGRRSGSLGGCLVVLLIDVVCHGGQSPDHEDWHKYVRRGRNVSCRKKFPCSYASV